MIAHEFGRDDFQWVRQALEAIFEEGNQFGASVCFTRNAEPAVDLWGRDAYSRGTP